MASQPRLRIRLFPRAEKAVRRGHPWIFGESIRDQNREGEAGELAIVYDRKDQFLAVGLYDPASPIRVRVVHQGQACTIDQDWWRQVIGRCVARRSAWLADGGTTGLRLINGDSEGVPGLVVDRYADTLVAKVYSTIWLPRWHEMESLLREQLQPQHLVLRLARNIQQLAREEWDLEEGFRGEGGEEVVLFEEHGLRFEAAVLRGQKTGFFLDQRDNRRRVEGMARGRRVLNLFSFSGAFSLYAARGGARSVTDLDISAHALEGAARNLELNRQEPAIAAVESHGIQADAFEWLEQTDERYDLVVVDPPSLAKREREREQALRAYETLNRRAIRLLNPGGILLAASCSAHVRAAEFHAVIGKLAQQSGKACTERWRSGHAEDHPATFPEAGYLKAQCLEFHS